MNRKRCDFPSGAQLVVQDRKCYGMPAWCYHIGIPVDRELAASALRNMRKTKKKIITNYEI